MFKIAKRDKKAFLNEQCKLIDENNNIQNTRDLFKDTVDIKRIFHARIGTIKDRNDKDLTEEKRFKKRWWQKYTEELYKKDLHDPDKHNGVFTHLETDILESEFKWVLGNITTNKGSGGDGIPA